jgi:hypothetical protein
MPTTVARTPEAPRRTSTKTIRVRTDLHDRLQAMATAREQSIGRLLEELIEERRKAEFYAQMEEAYRRLRADPAASAAYDAEIALWDNTLLDGLGEEAWEEAWDEQ